MKWGNNKACSCNLSAILCTLIMQSKQVLRLLWPILKCAFFHFSLRHLPCLMYRYSHPRWSCQGLHPVPHVHPLLPCSSCWPCTITVLSCPKRLYWVPKPYAMVDKYGWGWVTCLNHIGYNQSDHPVYTHLSVKRGMTMKKSLTCWIIWMTMVSDGEWCT